MGKSLKSLANQLKKNHGFHLVPTFDDGIIPGTVLECSKWNDINRLGHLKDDSKLIEADLGLIEGPTPCMLADFNRLHELSVDAAVDMMRPVGNSAGNFRKAKEVVASFGGPVIYSRSVITLETALEKDKALWGRPIGQAILARNTYVVFQVVKAKLSFLFRSNGNAGIDMQAEVGTLKAAGLNNDWSWRNHATLESKKEIIVAAEFAKYSKHKKRLVAR